MRPELEWVKSFTHTNSGLKKGHVAEFRKMGKKGVALRREDCVALARQVWGVKGS